MIKEKYIKNVKEISLNISQSQIESIRKKDISKTGLRVYDQGFIGIAGAVGEIDQDRLEKMAIENLKLQIPYPSQPSTNMKKTMDLREGQVVEGEFLEEVERLLERLRKEFPEFSFSNKISIHEYETKLINTSGLELIHRDRLILVVLAIKEKASANIIDASFVNIYRDCNWEEVLDQLRETLTAYEKKLDLPARGKQPVIFLELEQLPLSKLISELNGYKLGTGASLFEQFIGKKKFSVKFSLYQATGKENLMGFEFFDAEGVVNPDYKYSLIENGKIISPYTDKQTAHKFNLPLTGSASAEYDKVPNLEARGITVKASDKSLKELLDGQLGIVAIIAAGGDFSQEGVFDSPIQLAFLTDGEKLLGRLDGLQVSGDLYSMFGEDYIGKSKGKDLLGQRALVFNLEVDYI